MMRLYFVPAIMSLLLATVANAETVAFVNVNVVPMTSDVIVESQTVIVSDGLISFVGDFGSTAVPDDARIVDGTDRYLMPGLVEMHGHVPGRDSRDLERVLSLYVANGVTTVRGMLGQPSHLELRESIKNGDTLGPRLITSGPSFNGRSVGSPEAGSDMVRAQHAAGYDFLKIHPGLTRGEFDAIAETANELGIPFAGHVPEDVGVPRALEAGIATIDHLDGYMETLLRPNVDPSGGLAGFFGVFIADQADEGKIAGIAAATAAAGVWNVPTDSLFVHVVSPELAAEDLADRSEMKYMRPGTVAQWVQYKSDLLGDANFDANTAVRAMRLRQQLILALHKAGAGLLLGSDSPQVFNVPGFALHHELELIVAAGLTPYEAIRTGTANAARFFDQEETWGSVRQGLVADLVVLDASPLEDITNSRRIHGVMIRGHWLSRADLDALLSRFER
jgi:imidazolonepropionase-like amidohydrolase